MSALVIVFGAGKPQIGALILPSPEASTRNREALLKAVWPAVEAANRDAPSHSQLVPEMIEFLP